MKRLYSGDYTKEDAFKEQNPPKLKKLNTVQVEDSYTSKRVSLAREKLQIKPINLRPRHSVTRREHSGNYRKANSSIANDDSSMLSLVSSNRQRRTQFHRLL